MEALCAFSFEANLNAEQKESVDKDLKAPVLNNIALCLIKQKKFGRAN